MNFYKLEKKEYKKLSKEFKNTYVGGHLYLIFDWFCGLSIFGFFLKGFCDGFFGEKPEILEGISSINCLLLALGALIAYALYFINLKKYCEEKNK